MNGISTANLSIQTLFLLFGAGFVYLGALPEFHWVIMSAAFLLAGLMISKFNWKNPLGDLTSLIGISAFAMLGLSILLEMSNITAPFNLLDTSIILGTILFVLVSSKAFLKR